MYFNQGINWVQGENAAKSWYVPAGQTALLMDSEDMKFYLKSADASGIPLPLRTFAYTEVKEAPKGDSTYYITKDEYDALTKRIEVLEGAKHESAV